MARVLIERMFLGNPVNHGIEGTVFKVVCQIGALSTVKTTGSILTGSILPPIMMEVKNGSHFHDYGRKTMDPRGLRSISDVFSVRKGLQKSLSWNSFLKP